MTRETRPDRISSRCRIRSTERSRIVDPASDHDHATGRNTRDAAEQQAPSAEWLLEEVSTRLCGQATRDLAHRREQRQCAVVRLDRLVRNRGDAAVDKRPRQRLVRRDVEVREEHEPVAQTAVLGLDRLFDLEQELAPLPDLVDAHDSGADGLIGVVGEGAPLPRAGLDEHVVAALD